MDGTWSKINGYENYSISNEGYVRNDKTGKMKALRKSKSGYDIVSVYKDGHAHTFRVHRLVGENFIDNPNNKPQINHIDGNKSNNKASNLEWVTAKENMEHASKNGLVSRKPSYGMLGKKNPNAGCHGLPVRIVETNEVYDSIIDCSKAINGSDRGICEVLKGRQRTHRGLHFEYYC